MPGKLDLFTFPKDEGDKDKPKINLPPGTKACHKFMSPFTMQNQTPVAFAPDGKPSQVRIDINPQIGFFPCLESTCNLFNESEKKCQDRLAMEAQCRIASRLEQIADRMKPNEKE